MFVFLEKFKINLALIFAGSLMFALPAISSEAVDVGDFCPKFEVKAKTQEVLLAIGTAPIQLRVAKRLSTFRTPRAVCCISRVCVLPQP